MQNKKALILGILASFFFAFTFIFNRSMHLSGGSWVWSAGLRYLFTFPIMALITWRKHGFSHIHKVIKGNLRDWIIWSTVGFGLFYAPLSFAADYGESWLIASSWQITIVMGVLIAPLFNSHISVRNLFASGVILVGVFLLQVQDITNLERSTTALTLIPILIAAISYPLGNRKMMAVSKNEISTIERIYGMTLCSLPFWIILSIYGTINVDMPTKGQIIQVFGSALFSGVIATLLFFKATDLVKSDQRQLAVVESTQSGEVIFTLLGGIFFLKDTPPDWLGGAGILLIVFGMILNSLLSSLPLKKDKFQEEMTD